MRRGKPDATNSSGVAVPSTSPVHSGRARDVLTPEALAMLQAIGQMGSFAAAARAAGMVPSALTYRVRRIEDALDVLLFDRRSRQAKLTIAGQELLKEGRRLLADLDFMAERVRRVASGWEPQFTIAVDSLIARETVLELCGDFYGLAAPTRLKLIEETLSGTLEALTSGRADLALGVVPQSTLMSGTQHQPLGSVRFVFVVASHHPLARAAEPLSEALIRQYRAIAVADSVRHGDGLTVGWLSGQEIFAVPDLTTKLAAHLRGLGVGTLPENLVKPYVESGRLVQKQTESPDSWVPVSYAWRQTAPAAQGLALQWWLSQLAHEKTRTSLLHGGPTQPDPSAHNAAGALQL